MKTRLYLIRHGETLWNIEHRYQGITDINLSDIGLKQAELLGKRFKGRHIDIIYSSPLARARQTAKFISDATNIPVQNNESFREIDFGEWEGNSIEELTQKYGEKFTNYFKEPFKYSFPGEGSFDNVIKRVKEGYDKLLNENEGKTIVIVSHGAVLRVLITYIMNFEQSFYKKTWLNNTSITTIDIRDGIPTLLTLNDKAHLENGVYL